MADAKLVKAEKMPDSTFQQQHLPAWQPLFTTKWLIIFLCAVGVVLLAIGIPVYQVSKSIVYVEARYDLLARDPTTNFSVVSLEIPRDMNPPIFFYYKLVNFYQNHRRYCKSYDSQQLKAEDPTLSHMQTYCDPLYEGGGKLLYPCGLIPQSYFTDSFSNPKIISPNSTVNASWSDVGIAWELDKEKFVAFKTFDNTTQTSISYLTGKYIDHTTEDFMVWMRQSGLPTFMKFRYKISSPLKQGDKLNVTVYNVFDVDSFGGEKYVVLTTTNKLGGANPFLGISSIVAAALSFAFAIFSGIWVKLNPRQLGDLSYCEPVKS